MWTCKCLWHSMSTGVGGEEGYHCVNWFSCPVVEFYTDVYSSSQVAKIGWEKGMATFSGYNSQNMTSSMDWLYWLMYYGRCSPRKYLFPSLDWITKSSGQQVSVWLVNLFFDYPLEGNKTLHWLICFCTRATSMGVYSYENPIKSSGIYL